VCWAVGQADLGEKAVYEVAALLDVPQAASAALDEVFGSAEGHVGQPAASQERLVGLR
jgi:hypothetical protein